MTTAYNVNAIEVVVAVDMVVIKAPDLIVENVVIAVSGSLSHRTVNVIVRQLPPFSRYNRNSTTR